MKAVDLTGRRFGRLVALDSTSVQKTNRRRVFWRCKCDCDNFVTTSAVALTTGETKSCGCLKAEGPRPKHGAALKSGKTPEYRVWMSMKKRCLNENDKTFPLYGGRGITVCAQWMHSFEQFLTDMGPRPSLGHSIDRIDNAGNYEPNNCRWGTHHQQAQNRKSTILEVEDVRRVFRLRAQGLTLKAIGAAVGISFSHVRQILSGRSWPDVYREVTRREPEQRKPEGKKLGLPAHEAIR